MKFSSALTALILAAGAHTQETPRCNLGLQTTTHSQYFASNAPLSERMVQENIGYVACDKTTLAAWVNHYQGKGWIDRGVALERAASVGERAGAINLALLNITGIGKIGHIDARLHTDNNAIGVQRLIGFGDGTRGYLQTSRATTIDDFSAGIQAELGASHNYLRDGFGVDASILGNVTYDLKPFTFTLGSGIVRDNTGTISPTTRFGIGIHK